MSETKTLSVSKGTVVRSTVGGGGNQGCGNNRRLYVGRRTTGGTARNYQSFLRFTMDWTDVGRINSATLQLYTDDGLGLFPLPGSKDTPKIIVKRLTDGFTEGNNDNEDFDASDYTTAASSASGQKHKTMAKQANGLTEIDITEIVKHWAPASAGGSGSSAAADDRNFGIKLYWESTDPDEAWSGWSEDATNPGDRPVIILNYELGLTDPDAPTDLSPVGEVASIGAFQGDFTDQDPGDRLAKTEIEVYKNDGTTLVIPKITKAASNTEQVNARFNVVPENLNLVPNTNYKWRARVTDQGGSVSAWTALQTFSIANTNPDAPSNMAPNADTFATLNGVEFSDDSFTDPDDDALLAFQVQLTPSVAGNSFWSDPTQILWDTGKQYVSSEARDAGRWATVYGGQSLAAGEYFWRARHWDARDGVSDWSADVPITISADFEVEPGTQDTVQIDPHAPWRLRIHAMGENRGPGDLVARIENAKSLGASIVYNSPGEAHWTLPVDHQQIGVIEPKQTHYAIDFYSGDGWRETFAGLVWDYDAVETSVVFTGIDYLALYDLVLDERYDPAKPDRSYADGGSKYSNKSIRTIIHDQLDRARKLANSPVGFIGVDLGDISASMTSLVTIWSTMQPVLSFCAGLIDSHRQGSVKRTRIQVVKTSAGGYKVRVVDSPGQTRDSLRLKYGELVQGYRVIPFGPEWSSVLHSIGRTREGLKVMYKTASAPGIDQSVWGRIARAVVMDNVSGEADLTRRTKQAALHAGRLGKAIALAVRSGVLRPLDGYDVTDAIPVHIQHGAVDTTAFGSGYWVIYAVTWEAMDDGSQNVTLTLSPRDDTAAPSTDLVTDPNVQTQAEWQIGWTDPDTAKATSRYWLDQSTGQVWVRDDEGNLSVAGTGTITT